MGLLIFYVALALGVSFLCSVMEAVLLSVSPSFVARMEKESGSVGRRLRAMKDDVDRPLAAILSLNTIAHTVGAAGAGAQAAAVFGDTFVGIISAVLTFLILVLSEIIPKTLGAVYWRQLAPWVVRLLQPTIWLMWPLVKMSEGLTRFISRKKNKTFFSREEFSALTDLGTQQGVFDEGESQIIQNLLRFGQILTADIMTPRTVVFAMPEAGHVADAVAEQSDHRFSRIPLYGENIDDVKGFVLKDEVLHYAALQKGETPLTALKREIMVVPETLPLPGLFERLMEKRAHIALVVDEFGGTAGVVTMEDLIETLLGLEIVDEADTVSDMQELARREWIKRARRLGIISESDEITRGNQPAKE
jgi:CBS domain containing-hemolysin-like protein